MDAALSMTAPTRPGTFTVSRQPPRISLLADCRRAEQLTIERLHKDKVDDSDFAALVRALCSLVQTIQELRGIPKPGQLRPDLDPVQLQRAIKRARARRPLDIGAGIRETLATISETAEEPTTEKACTKRGDAHIIPAKETTKPCTQAEEPTDQP